MCVWIQIQTFSGCACCQVCHGSPLLNMNVTLARPAYIATRVCSMTLLLPMVSLHLHCQILTLILISHLDWVLNQSNISNTNSSGREFAYSYTGHLRNANFVHVLRVIRENYRNKCAKTRFTSMCSTQPFYPVKTGRWNGVVTAFITMIDVKDEIDWEFPRANTIAGQTTGRVTPVRSQSIPSTLCSSQS